MNALSWSLRQYREKLILRHVSLSLLGWGVMYVVFLLEVWQLNMHSQHAKLSITLLGFPLGIFIQWAVFKERITEILRSTQRKRDLLSRGSQWAAIKLVSIIANQVGYAVVLHRAGLPFWAAYPVAAAALSLLYFAIHYWWIFRINKTEA